MSLKNHKNTNDALSIAVANVSAQLNTNLNSVEDARGVASMESLGEGQRNAVLNAYDNAENSVREALTSAGLESLSDAGLEAATIAAMASADPAGYARVAMTSAAANALELTPSAKIHASMEAFDEKALKEAASASVLFNYSIAAGDAFTDLFFHPQVHTPDVAAVETTVNRLLVFKEVRHSSTGKATDFKKRNLIDASVDHTILQGQETALVPWLAEDGHNADAFAPATLVGARSLMISGVSVNTAPLRPGHTVNLLGLSANPALIGAGVLDNLDAIDGKIQLSEIVLQHADGERGISIRTAGMPRSEYIKSVSGNYKEMNLHFPIENLVINGDTTDETGAEITALAAVKAAGWNVHVSMVISGELNVETGNGRVWASPITVSHITNAAGQTVDPTLPAAVDAKALVESFGFGGYVVEANRTNSNLRTRGTQLDITFETERYAIPLGAPINVPTPHTQSNDNVDLKVIIAAARTKMRNEALTTLFDRADALETWCAVDRGDEIPTLVGMGRFFVRPYFKRLKLNMVEALNSMRSQDRAADISAVLLNVMRDQAYEAYQKSRIQPAFDARLGGTGEKPKLLIGTDQKLVRHMQLNGDDRTFGILFEDFQIEASPDARMYDKIVMSFGRAKPERNDPLHFGFMAMIPELVAQVPVHYNGSNVKQTLVQPRFVHVCQLPVLVIIEVSGMSEVLADKTLTPALAEVTGPSEYMGSL